MREEFFVDGRGGSGGLRRSPRRAMGGRARRKMDHAATQIRFMRRRSDCAREILDGAFRVQLENPSAFLQEWRDIMTGPSTADISYVPSSRSEIRVMFQIEAQEVKSALLPRNTAAGPDGFPARVSEKCQCRSCGSS